MIKLFLSAQLQKIIFLGALVGIASVAYGITYLIKVTKPKQEYKKEIKQEATSYAECVRNAEDYKEAQTCLELF